MSRPAQTSPRGTSVPTRHLQVFRAGDFRVVSGVNEGDPLGDASELAFEDIYALAEEARPVRLALAAGPGDGAFRVGDETGAGQPDAPVYLDCLLTFMGPAGGTRDALVFVETAPDGTIAEVYLYPLAPLTPKRGYALVTVDRQGGHARLAGIASVAFTRGTRITLAGGSQRRIEDLRPGDRVLTRDSGPQVLRWIGLDTMRAAGPFAPITIRAGALHNTHDLVVSPGHRLFVYQRIDALRAGRKEVLVRAELLVNGTSVTRDEGGFVDYFQLLFDKHEIIYAEGIAAESLFVDTATRATLPDEVARRIAGTGSAPRRAAHEMRDTDLAARKDAAEALRRLSAL